MNTKIKNICFEKKWRLKLYLNINREIMRLSSSQKKNDSRLNSYISFSMNK